MSNAMPTRPPGQGEHFQLLDGLRGIAAIAVMISHHRPWYAPAGFASAYLAVDFFFMLSGFVIAYVYDRRLEAGMGFPQFLASRIIRLWPLIMLSLVLAGVLHLVLAEAEASGEVAAIVQLVVLGCFLIPMFGAANGLVYPLNNNIWSLFFEITINLIYAAVARWLVGRVFMAVLAVSAVAYAVPVLLGFDPGGIKAHVFWLGFARVAFPFFVGVGMSRLHRSGRMPGSSLPWLAAPLLLLLILVLPRFGGPLQLAAIFLLFPLIIWLGLACEARLPRWGLLVSREAGRLSYPVYLLHMPVYFLLEHIGWPVWIPQMPGRGIVALIVAAGLSYIALFGFDEPVRRSLRRLAARAGRGRAVRSPT